MCALALTMMIVGGVGTSAHRRDEYLQAAAVIADIDANRDGSLSATIQLQLATTVPALSTGAHQVLSATITTAMAVSI